MSNFYIIPSRILIGHIHLKIANLERALEFYPDLLFFKITQFFGDSAVFLSAESYHHHIRINTWQSKNAPPAPDKSAGLFHTAILFPCRRDLASRLKRMIDKKYTIDSASDHGISEAICLRNPDRNCVQLYWDKSKDKWPVDENGNLMKTTDALDIENILEEVQK